VKLYFFAEKELDHLFLRDGSEKSEEMFMIHRCISRITEMQSKKYSQEKVDELVKKGVDEIAKNSAVAKAIGDLNESLYPL